MQDVDTSIDYTAVDIRFSIAKVAVQSRSRSLRAAYTVELAQDIHVMYGAGYDELYISFYGKAGYHKHKKQKWIKEYTHRMKKMKGIEKINTQRNIDSLKNQIDNHEDMFAEYYL